METTTNIEPGFEFDFTNPNLIRNEFMTMRALANESIERVKQLETELEQSRQEARDQAEQAEARRDQLRLSYDERMTAQRDRWHGELTAKQERIDALLETDQGKAWQEVEHMKREVTRAEERAERWQEVARQATNDRDQALASVAGGEDIHPSDPRVAHIWRKASRIATHAGFCSEYDRIAEALGLPDVEFDYSGYVDVRVSATVSVPVSGTATRREIADGDIDPDIDTDDIISNIDTYSLDWSIESMEIEANDE